MALRFELDTLDGLPAPLREHYTKTESGKYHLTLQGDPPKVAEFRDNNITLQKTVETLTKKFEGIDPDAVKADRLRLAEFEREKGTPGRVAELEGALAAERAARQTIEQQASDARVRDHLRAKALSSGAVPNGVEMLVDKGAGHFHVSGGAVVAKPNVFSPLRPGEPMTAEDWLATAVLEYPFLFKPSTGGNAAPARGNSSARPNELLDPTPADLGKHADAIRRGTLKVRYSGEETSR
ncbi:MAG: hypothetical protein AB7H93_13340 [Vicinamibacterales bacterium]